MKLIRARITGYKCVQDADLKVDAKVTSLAGASEAGKSALLEAIARFQSGPAFAPNELCSWLGDLLSDHRVVTLSFQLEPGDRESLGAVDSGLSTSDTIVVARRVDGAYDLVHPELGSRIGTHAPADLETNLRSLRSRANRLLRAIGSWLTEAGSGQVSEEAAQVEREPSGFRPRDIRVFATEQETKEKLQQAYVALEAIRSNLESGGAPTGLKRRATLLARDIEPLLPLKWDEFEEPSFDTNGILSLLPRIRLLRDADVPEPQDDVPIRELEASRSTFPVVEGILELAELDVAALKLSDGRTRRQRLSLGSSKATSKLSGFWGQEAIQVSLNVEQESLHIDLIGKEGHRGRPSEHSQGFRWFLSFVLAHLAPQRTDEKGVLLLDEPGLHLHASAQTDLLKLFESAPEDLQIVYVTHSPWMISRNWPTRVRAVAKRGETEAIPGTYIENTPYTVRRSRGWEPIRTALGLAAGISPFTTGRNLIVEGVGDQLLVTAANQRLTEQGSDRILDLDRIAICFGGGADGMIPLAQYCQGEAIDWVALFDGDRKGKAAAKKLLDSGVPAEAVGTLADTINEECLDIESVIGAERYHQLVIKAYESVADHPAASSLPSTFAEMRAQVVEALDLPAGTPSPEMPVSRAYDLFFRNQGEWGDFFQGSCRRGSVPLVARRGRRTGEGLPSSLWSVQPRNHAALWRANVSLRNWFGLRSC
jgi:hypothetical protein